MPRYVALLRAINVGGRVVKMDRLRGLFEEIGLANVESFIASGNLIFDSRAAAPAVEKKIEAHLHVALGYAVDTFLRTPAELATIAARQPFPKGRAGPGTSLYVGFSRAAVTADAKRNVLALASEVNRFAVEGREVYWLVQGNMMESRVTGAVIEKALGMPTTLRNVNTVVKLAAKYAV